MRNIQQRSLHCLAAALLLVSTILSSAGATQVMPPRAIPLAPRMVVPEAHLPVRLQKVDVRAEVLGAAAHTRIEMVFYNPNARPLEGELQFPLLDGQSVTGFALDIDGELRPAVAVDKAKGQQVFEDVTRARIDPALLEKTQGNNYKLRVYPLPAQGTRRVVLELDEVLARADTGDTNKHIYHSAYRLPLQFAETVGQLDVAVHNAASPAQYSALAVRARLGAERIKVSYQYQQEPHSGSLVSFSRKDYAGRDILSIDYPGTGTSSVAGGLVAGDAPLYAVNASARPAATVASPEVTMTLELVFAFEMTTLGPEEEAKLGTLAKSLLESPVEGIVIEGHANESGTHEYRMGIADRRATVVKELLVGRGVPRDKISTKASPARTWKAPAECGDRAETRPTSAACTDHGSPVKLSVTVQRRS